MNIISKAVTGILVSLTMMFFGVLLVAGLSGCGLMSSKGHFEMAGDQHGIRSMSDLLNGLANARHDKNGYWKQRHLDTTEEGYNDRQPGFWSKVFFGGGLVGSQKQDTEE